ncbi:MAG: NAD(P)-dependent oxidoreductase, partial [Betaproteobacteria bacterium HGW-Betaproteobacteria-12]
MLGNAMLRILSEDAAHDVFGTARSALVRRHFAAPLAAKIICGIDVENIDSLARLFGELRPQLVVN